MHMADALLSPVVGGAFWAVSAGMIGWSAKKISNEADGSKTVLMGVLGAFVFAAQMINFTIPGTGSSGHLGGGLLLTVLLGPWRAFITLASVLVIQALFFADGGLLALGCNIFNMAFLPSFIAWPFIYRTIAGVSSSQARIAAGSISAATAGLLMGAMSVVLQTTLSAISDLPFSTFILFMLPIHLAIGIVEGVVTWGVLTFVARNEPALLAGSAKPSRIRMVATGLVILAMATGGVLSWFASSYPDGLEWSMAKTSGKEELSSTEEPLHAILASAQERLAFLPDYDFRNKSKMTEETNASPSPVNVGTSLSGLLGSFLVLLLAGSTGFLLRKRAAETAHS
ncbi:MAG TPA: energy-coupling factor ABC transporter permease [Chlorobaculum sp.]|nr:energy-coupling factor ABC transporter permease [Chlorobaculum sp.]